MRISVLQLPVTVGDFARNAAALEAQLEDAAARGTDTVLLPELWDIGYFPRPIERYLDAGAAKARELLSSLARRYKVNIVGGSVAEKTGEGVKNTCFIFDRSGGCIARYSKTHLFTPAKEQKTFTPGDRLTAFRLDGVSCGIIICYDLRFPELVRRLALDGIEVLFIAAQWPEVRLEHWRILTQARAIDDQLFLAAANGSGAFANGIPLAGHSVIIDPWGRRLAEAEAGPSVITADINPAERQKIRTTFNFAADRRSDLYGDLKI